LVNAEARSPARKRVLLVDDEAGVRLGMRRFLESHGWSVFEADTCGAALAAFRSDPPDAAILDYRLPDGSGVELVPQLKALCPGVPLLILTAHGSIELAVKAVQEGADNFLTKPVDLKALLLVLQRLVENQRNLQKQLAGRAQKLREESDPFLGKSSAIRRLLAETQRLLNTDSPILIQGETGTGKGVLARFLHERGARADEAFVDLNCAGLSRELLESELFGHEKGAFTGASSSKPGLLEVAHRGTLFLDEIGDMDLLVQAKLLTVLEEQRFRRLGDVRSRHVDVRLVSATHHDLASLVAEKRFRGDLFFRISTVPLLVPPLRARADDIPLLAQRLLLRSARELGRGAVALAADALAALQQYHWPGNIRELRNVLERALLTTDGAELRAADLRFSLQAETAREPDRQTLEEMESREIRRALAAERQHVGRAATRLGIPRSTLYKKLRKLGIQASRG
jgi:DNA-binding NtrC family response regulator